MVHHLTYQVTEENISGLSWIPTMWRGRRICLVILLIVQFVAGIEDDSDSKIVRGDNIIPDSDYYYSQFIPIHNDFIDEHDSGGT